MLLIATHAAYSALCAIARCGILADRERPAQPGSKGRRMNISGSTALVTGANRGLGLSLVRLLREAGCKKIYAAARQPAELAAGVEYPVLLDITNPEQVTAAAAQCHDVDLLINNAGIAKFTPLLAALSTDNARAEMETNYFGTMAMCRAFAPVLKRNGGGALVNVLSVVSWFSAPMQGSYCASKSAEWSLTKAARFELRSQGTRVIGVHAGYIDTDMTAALTLAKTSPDDIARKILAGIERGDEEILADERAQALRAELLGDYGPFEAAMQQTWDGSRPSH
jgi:NAD(P)-dependent dehydrogenase (short-subunit alcohol dehydrogenase family)